MSEEHTDPATDPGYQAYLADCEAAATDAGFRGLLQAYLSGHAPEAWPELVLGAERILERIADEVLAPGHPEAQSKNHCDQCRLMNLIYPPSEEASGNN
jgi:hypothetical protein